MSGVHLYWKPGNLVLVHMTLGSEPGPLVLSYSACAYRSIPSDPCLSIVAGPSGYFIMLCVGFVDSGRQWIKVRNIQSPQRTWFVVCIGGVLATGSMTCVNNHAIWFLGARDALHVDKRENLSAFSSSWDPICGLMPCYPGVTFWMITVLRSLHCLHH